MHDLRHDPAEAAAPASGKPSPNGTPAVVTMPAQHLDPDQLRTVHMPELRSPEARLLDAAQRGYAGEDGEPRDVRTFPEMVVAELVRLVDTMQGLSLRQDIFEETLGERRAAVDKRLERSEERLTRLEDSLKRIADAVQIIALERDRK